MGPYDRDLLTFIRRSPTSFHAAANLAQRLKEAGYRELREEEPWTLSPGEGCFVRRNLSSLLAFRVPKGPLRAFQVAAAHGDSPALKVKHITDLPGEGLYARLNVERYGGMLCATWMDRPLSVAGRVLVEVPGGLESRLVDLDRDLLLIPNLAIHMERSANEGKSYSVQRDLIPLLGEAQARDTLMDLVAQEAGCGRGSILDADLYLYCRNSGRVWGAEEEFLSAPRLDDLQCAFCCAEAFLQAEGEDHPNVSPLCALFDNEEVGSHTKQGAASTFLAAVIQRVCLALGMGEGASQQVMAASFMVSADNAHAFHPNRPDTADPVHRPRMNGGVVLKYAASQRYATDGISGAIFQAICREAGVPVQIYHNHSDQRGGSTLGSLSNAQAPMITADVGLAQLAMHSAYETAGAKDTAHLIRALRACYTTFAQPLGEGRYALHRGEKEDLRKE